MKGPIFVIAAMIFVPYVVWFIYNQMGWIKEESIWTKIDFHPFDVHKAFFMSYFLVGLAMSPFTSLILVIETVSRMKKELRFDKIPWISLTAVFAFVLATYILTKGELETNLTSYLSLMMLLNVFLYPLVLFAA